MAYRITNNGKGPRGVHSTAGQLVWVKPGETKTIDPANIERERRVATFAIEPVGEVEAPPASLKKAVEKKAAPKTTRRKTTRRSKANK
jgi:hypothetical protein